MRKFLLLTVLLISTFISNAQFVEEKDKAISEQLVRANKDALKLSFDDLSNLSVHTAYQIPNSDIRMAYMQQTYKGLPVYNQVLTLAFKNGKLVSRAGELIPDMEEQLQKNPGIPSVEVTTAFMTALANREINLVSGVSLPTTSMEKENGKINFGKMGIFNYDVTAELMWYPMVHSNEKGIRLVWQFFIAPSNSSDTWMIRVDANSNTVVGVSNMTVYCNWDNTPHSAQDHIEKKHYKTTSENVFVYKNEEKRNWKYRSALVNNSTYRVIKYPAESPNHPGGAPQLHVNPWTWAPGNATTLGWHTSDNINFYDSTRGNNVFAYEDRTGTANTPGLSAVSTTAQPDLSFDFTPNFTVDPTQRTPVPNQQFNTTNLFYWNNLIHDVSYMYGFTEAARNYQTNNLGRGGLGNDAVLAEAQDNSGTNNANFASNADGTPGRMQMYLWTGTPQKDGDVDNGIVLHEYTHGISNRMTGTGSGCLPNTTTNEQMGEGWSDYYALMLTQNWATSVASDGFNNPRGIGTYAANQAITGVGIRPTQYTTNMAINPSTYAGVPSAVAPHGVGYIWCTMLWDMTWEIIQSAGISPNIFDPTGTGGNVIAFKLVQEGLRLQPCGPGFVAGRDAILKADTLFFGAQYSCAIIRAFARRGLGIGASQGLSTSITDGTPSFVGAEPIVSITSNFPIRPELSNIVYTTTVRNGCIPVSNYILTDTLPTHVTWVSGGSYNPVTRVVSFAPVNLGSLAVQTYQFTVQVNAGSYFPSVNRLTENADAVVAPAIPAGWTATTNNALAFWRTSTASVRSAPNSFFVNNITTPSDVQLISPVITPGSPSEGYTLSFWHRNITENGFDFAKVEASSNGGATWVDLGPYMTLNGYNNANGFTGNSGAAFRETRVNMGIFGGKPVQIRFRFVSDNLIAATGWYVDDITINNKPVVVMQSNLYNASSVLQTTGSNVVDIVLTCPTLVITTEPVSRVVCEGASTNFSLVATDAFSYQWQLSTNVGASWSDIAGATTNTVNVPNVVLTQSGHQYRAIVTSNCGLNDTSNAVTLTVTPKPVHTNITAAPNPVCAPGPSVLSGTAVGGTISGGSDVVIASSGALNLPIPDGGAPLTNNITMPAFSFAAAANLKIRLNITHTWVGDLRVTLTNPCGTTVVFDRPGVPAATLGNSADLNGSYIFDVGAATVLPEVLGTTPIPPGSYRPSDANGAGHFWSGLSFPCSAAGTWTISVQDNAAIDAGTLVDWAILGPSAVGQYTHSMTGPFTITQNASTGGPSNPTANFTVSNLGAGVQTYSLTSTDSRGCSVTSPINVTVNPRPSTSILPTITRTFNSTGGVINIPASGVGSPYPSVITTSGLPANAQIQSVTLNGMNHTFPGDLDIMLQSPNGTNVILMSDRMGTNDLVNTTFTFRDGFPILGAAANPSGTYAPTNTAGPDNFPAPGPGSFTQVNPTLATFNTASLTPNGNWNLFVIDNATPDLGNITSWSITFAYSGADVCNGSSVQLAILDTVRTISSATPITIPTIPGIGNPYPAPLVVSGLSNYAKVRSVTLNGVSHTTIGDIDVMLRSPNGTNVILMSDVGGNNPVVNANYTFQDGFPVLAAAAASPSGTYAPTNTAGPDDFPAPGPGIITQINPTINSFNTAGLTVNGTWNLYVVDLNDQDGGSITGWSITFDVPGATTITYTWSPSTGLSSTTGNPVTASPTFALISPATSITYSVTAVNTVTGCASSTPGSAIINILALPAITTQPLPATQIICPGFNVSYTVVATGAGLTYQWNKNGTPLVNGGNVSGATSATLTLTGVTTADAATYTVVVSGTCAPSVTSSGAVLQIGTAPTITTQPAAATTVCERYTATISVVAAAVATSIGYKWQVSTDNITFTDLANSAAGSSPFYNNVFSPTLTIGNAPLSINGRYYRVVITTACNFTITSASSRLTVNPTPVVTAVPITARVCYSDTLVTLSGSPAGGVWSGVGVVPGTNTFLPYNAAVGTFPLKYKVTTSGCSDSAVINVKVEDCGERIRLLRNDGVLLYPNPNNGQFNLRVNSTLYNYLGMKIYTSSGQMVKQQNWSNLPYGRVIPIDIRHLPAAVYMVYVYYDDGVRTSAKTFKVVVPAH